MKATEARLEELRRIAAEKGTVDAAGIRATGAPLPPTAQAYYDIPLLKPPVWTWEIPLYFFVGGAAGIAAMIGVAAQLGDDEALVRDARRIALAGAIVSTPLLISDLGRPERFLNMLRVFKPQSPMSVGAWTLAVFGGSATVAAFSRGFVGHSAALVSAVSGLGMATYTGVLLGATAIPVWAKHAGALPAHFAASSTGSAVALLELRGHHHRALAVLGMGAAMFETYEAEQLEMKSATERVAELFSGPIPLALRLIGGRNARRAAAVSSLLGSILTRFAWVEAGKA